MEVCALLFLCRAGSRVAAAADFRQTCAHYIKFHFVGWDGPHIELDHDIPDIRELGLSYCSLSRAAARTECFVSNTGEKFFGNTVAINTGFRLIKLATRGIFG